MRQLLHSMKDGAARLMDVPVPDVDSVSVLVETRASIISVGTERQVVEFNRASWIERALDQPDKVVRVLKKMRTEGVARTIGTVRSTIETPIPLGYCQAGIVRAVGSAVTAFAPGDRVVTNGPHAEYVRVPQTLAARIPDELSFELAAFTPLAAIGLHGIRLAQPTIGETVVVYGLGLIGLLTVQLARAAGCRVIGIDREEGRCDLARQFGADVVIARENAQVWSQVHLLTEGIGADAVLLTVATDSDEPVHQAAQMSRKRGRIVLVGVTGLNLKRADFYEKELSFQVSCSYGPGRYDPSHEARGVDYPLPYVRWTEGRNFEAVLGLMRSGALNPKPLITHTFALDDVERAYDAVAEEGSALGIVLSYPESGTDARRTIELRPANGVGVAGRGAVGWIGAGSFAKATLIPAFEKAGATLDVIVSSGGTSATTLGRQYGFRRASTDVDAVLADPTIDTIVIATRHDSHASWTVRALEEGKHVFVEKPLALAHNGVDAVERALQTAPGRLCVGFNRRFAADTQHAVMALRDRKGPLAISILVNAGAIPRTHWTQRIEEGGGRIVGEACHFIDLARYLVGDRITALQVAVAHGRSGAIDDITTMNLSFADGSIASIHYLANGHKAYPKERVDMFFDGRVITIDDFRGVQGFGAAGRRARLTRSQDKGHEALASAFLASVRGAPPPIPHGELLEVSRISIVAASLAAAGGGATTFGIGDAGGR